MASDWIPRSEWRNRRLPRSYRVVSVAEARKRTGLEPEQLLCLGAEELTREFADARRERALRLPSEFVPEGSS